MVEHRPPPGRPTRDGATAPARVPDPASPSGGDRLPDGQLAPLLLQHMRAHPDLDFSPYELAKVLHRSHGTISRHLLHLAAAGVVTRTTARPARFQITT
jgi:hypothetical protein